MSRTWCRPYTPTDRAACLQLFDSNVPAFFDPNERVDYQQFLDTLPSFYRVCLQDDEVVGAYGLAREDDARRGRLKWIMAAGSARGSGLGAYMMGQVIAQAAAARIAVIDIAASHRSAPFFARYGAEAQRQVQDGWGPGLDLVDMELRPGTERL